MTRRRVLALLLPLAAVLLVVGEALTPKGLDHPITKLSAAAKEIPIAHAHSGQLYLSNMLVIFGLGALGVSFAALATAAAVVGDWRASAAGSSTCWSGMTWLPLRLWTRHGRLQPRSS